jgi:hypothetical protein
MKTIPLRTLIRQPLKVKRMTGIGKSVRITDEGEPLRIIKPAAVAGNGESGRRYAIDRIFAEVLAESPSKISAARLLEQSRR